MIGPTENLQIGWRVPLTYGVEFFERAVQATEIAGTAAAWEWLWKNAGAVKVNQQGLRLVAARRDKNVGQIEVCMIDPGCV
jgi:hypothetical protein